MRLIVKYHPDKSKTEQYHPNFNSIERIYYIKLLPLDPSPDAANRFISIREAWSLLRDPQHRQLYDTAGK